MLQYFREWNSGFTNETNQGMNVLREYLEMSNSYYHYITTPRSEYNQIHLLGATSNQWSQSHFGASFLDDRAVSSSSRPTSRAPILLTALAFHRHIVVSPGPDIICVPSPSIDTQSTATILCKERNSDDHLSKHSNDELFRPLIPTQSAPKAAYR